MIDVKKLITGFLVLATAAGASGIILSFVSGTSVSAQSPAEPQIGAATANTNSPIAANAFVDTGTIQGNAAEVLNDVDTSSTQTAAGDPMNITNAFADSFLNGLVSANPSGAIAGASDTTEFNPPNVQDVADELSASAAVKNFKTPDWDVEVDQQPIKTVSGASPAAIAQYSDSLNAIFNKYFVSTELQDLVNKGGGDPSTMSYVDTQVQGALNDTLALQVPSSLVPFQKSLVRVLVYEKNSAALSQLANTDPVKASLILQGEQTDYMDAINSLQAQMKTAASVGLLFGPGAPSSSVPFLAQLFGVKPAQALFGVGDISFDPAVFGEMILNYAQSTILQILKNLLVALIQRRVLTWIQGSGAPRFVTNYASQLVGSFQTAAVNKINGEISCVPVYQQQVLKVLLSTPAIPPGNGNNSCAAEFQGQLNNNLSNLSNLYGHFTNFNDYFAVMGPTGNTWGNLINIRDSALAAGNVSQSAKTTQNVAQQGWLGSAVCDDGSDPKNGSHQECGGVPFTDSELNCSDGSVPDTGICENGDQATCDDGAVPEIVPNDGSCADGSDPTITSPGQVTGQSMGSSLGSSIANITSANNIAGLIEALASSLLNTLAQNAINYATKAGTSAITDSGVSGIPPATLTSAPASTTATVAQCLPSIQAAILSTTTFQASVTVYGGGGKIDSVCASGGFCPSTENSDGTAIYTWSAPGSLQAANGTPIVGQSVPLVYTAPGQYFANVTASTDNTTASCEIDVQ